MFKNVIVPIDLTDESIWKTLISTALNIIDSSCKLHLIHVIPEVGLNFLEDYLPQEWLNQKQLKAKIVIEELVKKLIPQEILVEQYVTKGKVYDEVVNYAEKVKADLIIVTSFKLNDKDYILGPNAKKIIKHSKISVLLMRP